MDAKRLLTVAAMLSAFAARGDAQEPAATFRAATTLIEVTVVATDEQGRPVTDLTADDFTVVEQGQPRRIAFFRFEGSVEKPPAPEPLPKGLFTNRSEYSPGPPRNVTAIVIDSLNTQISDQMMLRDQLMRYLREIETGTRVAIYRSGETLQTMHDFTDDVESLRARLSKTGAEAITQTRLDEIEPAAPSAADGFGSMLGVAQSEMARMAAQYQEQLQERKIRLTLASLQAIGNHLAGVPGRKTLVWISGSIPTRFFGPGGMLRVFDDEIREAARSLASHGIAIYTVETSGVTPVKTGTADFPASDSAPGALRRAQTLPAPALTKDVSARQGTASMLSSITGGRTIRNTNDLTQGLKESAADLRGTYSIGFYVPNEAAPSTSDRSAATWHEFKVETRAGVKLLQRQGYTPPLPTSTPQEWTSTEWQDTVTSPVTSTAIRLDVRCEVSEARLRAVLQIASDDLHFQNIDNKLQSDLDITFAERTATGWTRIRTDQATLTIGRSTTTDFTSTLTRFQKEWTMNPDTTAVRLVVRDRLTGRYGSLDIPLGLMQEKKP